MNNEKAFTKKKVVYKYTKPLLTFTKKENPFELRTKSAPPLNIIEEKAPAKKFVLCRPDGTPITADDFSDVSDSSEEEDKKVFRKKSVSKEENKINEDRYKEKNIDFIMCPTCPKYNALRTNILNDLLKMYKNISTEKEKENLIDKEKEILIDKEKEILIDKEKEILIDKEKEILIDKEKEILIDKEKEILIDKEENIKQVSSIPYTFVPKVSTEVQIKYSISDILNYDQITPFPLVLLTKESNKVPVNADQFRVKVETIYEKATFELNKLTKETSRTIIYNLKKLDLKTIKEAKFIGNLIVFKAVREPQYCLQYAIVVGELKKVLKSKEEEKLNRKQTAFFGTVLTSVMDILSEEIRWADGTVLDMKSFKNRSAYEHAFEEQETERYAKKKKTLGAVDFVSHLYNLNIISFTHIKNKLDEYLKIDNEEVVEVLGRFIDNIGQKLYSIGMADYANIILNYLSKCKDKYVSRVRFYLMDVLDRKKTWKKPVQAGNTFANMEIEEVEEPKNIEVVKKEVKDNSGEILRIVGNIYEDISDADGEEDEIQITDNFKMGCDDFGAEPFFTVYISECVTNFKKSKVLVPFLVKYFTETGLSKEDLIRIIYKHKGNINELKIDAPLSPKNYTGMINKLKEGRIIDEYTYKDLQID
jgi:translation initiation factor 4G